MPKPKINKAVLAYSGGLDTSVILKWLQLNYNAEVITFSADLGQGEKLEEVREKAKKTGAVKVYIEDLRDEFVKNYVFPALQARAIYESKYMLSTALGRPLIAKRLVEIACEEEADAIAHGATGKGNDQVRFDTLRRCILDLQLPPLITHLVPSAGPFGFILGLSL